MTNLHGSSGDESVDMEAKELLIESSLDQVFEEYDFALEHGVKNPVVFLVDCEDELGSPMARAWEGDDAVDAAIMDNFDKKVEVGDAKSEVGGRRSEKQDTDSGRLITTLVRAFSHRDCCREVPEVFPYLKATFDAPLPTEGFLAVVVTAGGAATFTVPHSARP